MLPDKRSLPRIVLPGLLLLCVLAVLGYSLIHQKTIWATIGLYSVIFILICLSIRFYLRSIENVSTNYQKLFDSNPLAIYVMSKGDLKILGVNKAMTRLYGYTEKEFLNMTALDIRPKEEHEAFKQYVLKENKEPDESGVAVHQKKNGEKFYIKFNFHAVPVIKADAVLVMITDIDKELKNEQRINELVHLYEVVNQATHDVIWDYDLPADKLYWMQGFEETYGYTRENSPHDFWAMKMVYDDDRAKTQQFFRDIIATRQREWVVEYRYVCADGTVKYVRDKGLLLFDEYGDPVRLIGAMQDIDKQMRFEQQLISQNNQFKEIAWINSHEVRRPLANILALITLIKDYPGQPEELSTMINLLNNSSQELDNAVTLINKRATDDPDVITKRQQDAS